ncbi:hypothetical protein [Aestuariispira insulae]|uniref:Uncharacterized protein n=1 Tax=Aestuariispira insulae TaxID=1461337 RepID=A0A3D9HVB4_9PROT|nr:hypothetical protein [Aestuariispira insulae]RED53432.1 hypothetical protein DFP90_101221 [Aestuariispira insulae]
MENQSFGNGFEESILAVPNDIVELSKIGNNLQPVKRMVMSETE